MAPIDNTPAPAAKPYDAPSLTTLGSVAGLTAGGLAGTLDTLVGGNGGFQDPDPTS